MQDTVMEEIQTWSAGGYTPVGRSGHRISCSDSFLYCVGGYNPSYGALQETWRLNLTTCEWEQLSDSSFTPAASISHCLATSGHDLLMLGGTNFPFGSAISSQVEACDVRSGEWRTLPTHGDTPPQLYGQAARRHGEMVYTVGGTSGYHFSLHAHALHLPSGTWSTLADTHHFKDGEPMGRYRAEIGVWGGRVVVVGGADSFTVFPLDQVPVLNIDLGKWEVLRTHPDPRLQAHPSPRRCLAAVQRHHELYVVGGTDGTEVMDDVWRLDLVTLGWTRLPYTLPTPLYFHDASLTQNGCLYVYGGLSSVGSSERSSAVYRARLEAPPLLEAAWDAFTTYCPTLSTPLTASVAPTGSALTSKDFLAAGIPRNLLKRLSKLSGGRAGH
ncbi:kelch domain-containing protein 10 [Procambarus clarkii]|uniref:kelch domain-containing protein 10 n=1 Tax=Procambarus clarkii TaxID=6728 RepID=UPI0037448873